MHPYLRSETGRGGNLFPPWGPRPLGRESDHVDA